MNSSFYLALPAEEPPAEVLDALKLVRAWQLDVRAREADRARLQQQASVEAQSGLRAAADWRAELLGLPG